MPLNECNIIQQFFNQHPIANPYITLGIGDDAAIIDVPPGYQLVCSIDTLIDNIHFPRDTPAKAIGHKSLAVSLSDMAAMGAQPIAALLSLSIPEANAEWLKAFSDGFFALAERYQTPLIGGDTCRGPLCISSVVHGIVPQGKAIQRNKAPIDNLIYVSGTLGDAGLGLKSPQHIALLNRLNYPQARVELGLALQGIATAAIDISDGLQTDLEKLLHASQIGGEINANQIPLSNDLLQSCSKDEALQYALTAGDDYELCFTIPKQCREQLQQATQQLNIDVHCIGHTIAKPGLTIHHVSKAIQQSTHKGYQHFDEQ